MPCGLLVERTYRDPRRTGDQLAPRSISCSFRCPATRMGVHSERLQQDYASMTHRTAVRLTLLVTDLNQRKSTRRAVVARFDRQIRADQPHCGGSLAAKTRRPGQPGRADSARRADRPSAGPLEAQRENPAKPFRNQHGNHPEAQRNHEPSVLVDCKDACFSLGAVDAGEDLVGVLGPGERPGVVVPAVDERADGAGELFY
jgi:hypothetical protein